MMDEEKEIVEQAPEETEQVETTEAEVVPTKEETSQIKESWAEMRKRAARADKAEQERDEALRIARALAAQHQQRQQQPQVEEEPEEDLDAIDDSEFIDAKKLKKIRAQDNKRYERLERELETSKRATQEQIIHERLKNKFQDFDQVTSPENVARLVEMDRDIAESIYYNPDPEKKSVALYNAIKRYGIYGAEPENTSYRDKLKTNSTKPKPVQSIAPRQGDTPLDGVTAYAEAQSAEYRAKLLEKMEASVARVGNLVPRV